jgi:formylglycine-generating enzyme required for sulfatase activity
MKQAPINVIVLAIITVCTLIVFAGCFGIAARSVDGDCINHADVNLDGEITAGDAQAIFQVELEQSECADPLITGEHEPGDLYSVDNVIGNMRFVPAGTFLQGSPSDEPCRISEEGPQFEHTLTRNLAVMETEITRRMWAILTVVQPTLPKDPSWRRKSRTMNHPVQRVTWYEAVLFANLLSIENGFTPCYYLDDTFETVTNYITDDVYCNFDANGYRLPTEGEREYFTRAGTTRPFWADETSYSSDNCNTWQPSPPLNVLDSIAWWRGNSGYRAHPVGTKLANQWGLHDVHGNVWEWCWDRSAYPMTYPEGPVTDYTGPTTGSFRVFRGGSWLDYAHFCRSANRQFYISPGYRNANLGFRLVRSIP